MFFFYRLAKTHVVKDLNISMPPYEKVRGILFYWCLSVCLYVCLSVQILTLNLKISLLVQNYPSHRTHVWYGSTCHWWSSNEGHLSEVKFLILSLNTQIDQAFWEIVLFRGQNFFTNRSCFIETAYEKELGDDLAEDTSGYFGRMMVALAHAAREDCDADDEKAEEEAHKLVEVCC